MSNATKRKAQSENDAPPMSLEELARRMLAMPVKTREAMANKKAKKKRPTK